MSAQWRKEMALCAEQIAQQQKMSRSYMDEGWRVFEYAISAQERFEKAERAKKRNLLKTLLSNPKFYDRKAIAEFRNPLDLLAKINTSVAGIDETKAPNKAVFARWRRGWDSNPRHARARGSFQDYCLRPLGHLSRYNCAVYLTTSARPFR